MKFVSRTKAHGSSSRISRTSVTESTPRLGRAFARSLICARYSSVSGLRGNARLQADDRFAVTGDRYGFAGQRLVDETRELILGLRERINAHDDLFWLSIAIIYAAVG